MRGRGGNDGERRELGWRDWEMGSVGASVGSGGHLGAIPHAGML
jgi:hypothetical protein